MQVVLSNRSRKGGLGGLPPKFLEDTVILCFERQCPKQNSVIRLKSNILPPLKFLGWLRYCRQYHFITSVLSAGKFPHVHWHFGLSVFISFMISILVPLLLNLTKKRLKVRNSRYYCI